MKNIKKTWDGLLNKKMKGQTITAELSLVKLGLLLAIVIGIIIIFLFFTGYLDRAVEWVGGLFGSGGIGGSW